MAAITNCTAILTDPAGKYRLNASQALAAFEDLSLYTNAESCPMCASAIRWAGFREYIYGTSINALTVHGKLYTVSRKVFGHAADKSPLKVGVRSTSLARKFSGNRSISPVGRASLRRFSPTKQIRTFSGNSILSISVQQAVQGWPRGPCAQLIETIESKLKNDTILSRWLFNAMVLFGANFPDSSLE